MIDYEDKIYNVKNLLLLYFWTKIILLKETITAAMQLLHFVSWNLLACISVTLIRKLYVSLGVFSAYEELHLHKIWLLMVL